MNAPNPDLGHEPWVPNLGDLLLPGLVAPAANTSSAPASIPSHPPGFEGCLLEHVAAYEQLGWQLAPLRTYVSDGEVKQHPPKGWPSRTGSIVPELFDCARRLTHGVALVLGPSGVVDIDLDSELARALAPKFLRASAMFGRKGRVTHYLYRCAPQPHPSNGGPSKQAARRAFAIAGAMQLELRRGIGAQTTPPPTIKPDGFPAVWMSPTIELAAWEPEDEGRVEDLALACVFVTALERSDSGRHDTGLGFAAELARRGVDRVRAVRVIEAGFAHRGDDDRIADVSRCVDDTYAKHEADAAVAGIPDIEIRKAIDVVVGRSALVGARVNVAAPLTDVLDAIDAAFAACDEPALFRQGGLVTIDGPATAARLAVEAARVAHFVRPGKEADVVVHPGRELMEKFAARPSALPELLGRRAAPVLRPDGSVFAARGYDPVTRVWCDGWDGPAVEGDPRDALARLFAFADAGQWETPADGLAWLAHVLTVAARPAIAGAVPVWPYSSPMPGGGKSTLARVAGVLGGRSGRYTAPDVRDEDELARRLDAFALEPAVVLDNLRGVLRSTVLEGAISGGVLPVRRLYIGPAQVAWRAVLSITSNGAEIGRDWARRSIPVRLSSRALPGGRDVLGEAWAKLALTTDALIVMSSWLRAGVPSAATPLLGFGEWSQVVAGALAWLGCGDVVASTREASEDMVAAGDESEDLLDVIERCIAARPQHHQEVTARELWEAPAMFEQRETFRDFAAFAARLKRCGDDRRLLVNRKTMGRRVWRIEPR